MIAVLLAAVLPSATYAVTVPTDNCTGSQSGTLSWATSQATADDTIDLQTSVTSTCSFGHSPFQAMTASTPGIVVRINSFETLRPATYRGFTLTGGGGMARFQPTGGLVEDMRIDGMRLIVVGACTRSTLIASGGISASVGGAVDSEACTYQSSGDRTALSNRRSTNDTFVGATRFTGSRVTAPNITGALEVSGSSVTRMTVRDGAVTFSGAQLPTPILVSTSMSSSGFVARGTFSAPAAADYVIDAYALTDTSVTPLGTHTVTASAAGETAFAFDVAAPGAVNVAVTVSRADLSTTLGTSTFSNTLTPSPGTVTFIASRVDVSEDAGQVVLELTRSESVGESTVDVSVTPLSASANVDFTPPSGSITFASGERTHQLVIPILNDELVEGNESFTLSIVPTRFLQAGAIASASVHIIDDEPTTVTFAQSLIRAFPGTDAVDVVLNRDGPAGVLGIPLRTFDYTATAPADYAPFDDVAVFEEGASSATVRIPVVVTGETSGRFFVVGPSEDVDGVIFNDVQIVTLGDETPNLPAPDGSTGGDNDDDGCAASGSCLATALAVIALFRCRPRDSNPHACKGKGF